MSSEHKYGRQITNGKRENFLKALELRGDPLSGRVLLKFGMWGMTWAVGNGKNVRFWDDR